MKRITVGAGFAFTTLLLLPTIATAQQLFIDGTATYRERMALPPDAVFEATLQDVSEADKPAVVIGQTRIERPGNPPIHFTISYDSSEIESDHLYSVRARVVSKGQLLFTTDQSYQVLTQGHDSKAGTILMRRTSGPSGEILTERKSVPLRGTHWKLIELEDKEILSENLPKEAYLVFQPKGRVTGSGGCNRLTGTYVAKGSALRFNSVAGTMMMCIRGMDIEKEFLSSLKHIRTWNSSDRQLELSDENGKVLALFRAQAAELDKVLR